VDRAQLLTADLTGGRLHGPRAGPRFASSSSLVEVCGRGRLRPALTTARQTPRSGRSLGVSARSTSTVWPSVRGTDRNAHAGSGPRSWDQDPHPRQESQQRYRRRMYARPLRSAGPACRGTSEPDPAMCKPVCRAGPVATAACSLPLTTTGHARDAGRLGRAHPCGTVPSRGLSGQTPDSGACRPSGQPGPTL